MNERVRHVSVEIARDWREVYAFAASPQNMARWATGLGSAPRLVGGAWEFDGPEGPVRVRFTPRNELGVLDHHVTVPSGEEVYVPLRVIAGPGGCEVVFTVFRRAGATDEQFEADVAWVERDLATLKRLMEASAG